MSGNSTFIASNELYRPEKNTTGYIDGKAEPRVEIVSDWVGTGKTILDVGCYDGWYSRILLEKGNKVWGIDASKQAIRQAKKKGINAVVGDLETKLEFPSDKFDIIHAGEIIEHLYDTDTFIGELNRVLKPGGKLIITTPNVVSLPRRILYLFGKGRFFEASNSYSTEIRSVGHIRFFDHSLLKGFIESKGFEEKRFTSDFVNFPFFRSEKLARLKPTFGRTLIVEFEKIPTNK